MPSWGRVWSSWARTGCSLGDFHISRWQLRFSRIPQNVRRNSFNCQTWFFKNLLFPELNLTLFEGDGGNSDTQNLFGEVTAHHILKWVMACRSRASFAALICQLFSLSRASGTDGLVCVPRASTLWSYKFNDLHGGRTAAPLFVLGVFVEAFVGG